ncbi:UDP-glucose 4-epimerase [Macrolepiota fuliginosa MF-IS2]|uniref:UDP-glucose 4-epimerase n=1 Tax=Macrolepiota fuliginosa MF-IS2 TaxID=1400762 RepID=A0A9P5X773_9AGAR|nr:UDP-glucose 4-epimerase [Macrolepiota fuliginosa MF-IS2]
MASLQPFLESLLSSLPQPPIAKDQFNSLVCKTLDESSGKSSPENRKSQWEYLLKNEIFKLAVGEGKALKGGDPTYYDELKVRLDLVLTFTEQDACEQTFPFIVLQDLLETQTINSCSHIFSWIESRSSRLTESMVPQKGKALVLLRTLNDLLRRLSKSGSTTVFCGRILTFLSGVFPLGERSGVNLRGEYGPTWEDVWYPNQQAAKDVEMAEAQDQIIQQNGTSQDGTMEVDSNNKEMKKAPVSQTPAGKKEDLYNTFWHLQLPFSKPPLFANKDTFPEFKEAVNKVLPIIKEATAKERAMMGSRVGAGTSLHKRKRDSDGEETNVNEYFFAKFLTSPDLLDLENAKAAWATQRNRSLQIDFTLEQEDAQWAQETLNKAMDELKQTTPNGRAFAETIQTIMEREKNWVKWKNELCAPFDKETWSTTVEGVQVGLFEATKEPRDKMRKPREDWPHELGTNPLTEIWQLGYRELYDLERPFQLSARYLHSLTAHLLSFFRPGEVKDFVKKIKLEDNRIEIRKKTLARVAERQTSAKALVHATENPTDSLMNVDTPTSTPPAPNPALSVTTASLLHPSLPPRPTTTQVPSTQNTPAPTAVPSPAPSTPTPAPPIKKAEPVDSQIAKFEENKQRWAWLALRTARDQHLQHFGKIGTGDVELLVQEIEKDKQERAAEREKAQKVEEVASTVDEASSKTPAPELLVSTDSQSSATASSAQRAEMDIRMDGQADTHSFIFSMSTEPALKVRTSYTYDPSSVQCPHTGSHVIYTLQKTRRYKVISIDNYHNAQPAALSRISQLSQSELPENATAIERESTEIDLHRCDLTKPEQIRAVFEKYGKGGIWGVIHIAAYKAVGESTEIPLTYYANNVSASVSLLQTMDEFDCRRIVYSSSATVYGTPPIIPIPETTRLQADSPYGKTKVMAETIIEDLCQSNPEWRAISLRYFNPAGAHPSGLIGEDPRGRPGNLLPLLAHMAIGRVKDSTLKVFGNDYPTPDGTCVRDYLHILDLAAGHGLALDALTEDSSVFRGKTEAFYRAYNLGKGRGMSVLQIVDAMRKATGFDYKYEIIGRRRGDVPDLTADPSLAEKELGFKANQDLDTMCRDLWNWQSRNPLGYGGQ